MAAMSPRRVALNHTLVASPSRTSPATSAFQATKAVESMIGDLSPIRCTIR